VELQTEIAVRVVSLTTKNELFGLHRCIHLRSMDY